MATSYTSLLGLALPVTGELSGTWGDTVNNAITSLLDTAVAGTTTISTDGDVTLTTTTGAANQARQAIILCSGARTALRTITAPAQSKIYTVINATTGGYSVKLVGAGPTTGVTVVAGESAVVAWNGSDFIKISNTGGAGSFTNVTVSGTTTLSGLTASTALALDASKNVVSVTNTGTGNNVLADSPTFTGTPLSTTAAADTNTTQIATTAYVIAQGYLKSSTASSTYLTQSNAASTYLTQSNAASTYQTQSGMSAYLTTASAASTYLTQSNAASTYQTQAGMSSYATLSGAAFTGAIKEAKTAVSASNIDISTGNFFTKTISGTTTFTVSNTPSSGTTASFILDLTNGGSATVNWWSNVKWPGGVAPTLTSSGRDSLGFYTYDGGTTWTGLVLGKDIK